MVGETNLKNFLEIYIILQIYKEIYIILQRFPYPEIALLSLTFSLNSSIIKQ